MRKIYRVVLMASCDIDEQLMPIAILYEYPQLLRSAIIDYLLQFNFDDNEGEELLQNILHDLQETKYFEDKESELRFKLVITPIYQNT